MNRRILLLAAAALFALTFLAHAPALRNGFIWDDDDHVTRNPNVVALDGLQHIWSSMSASRYYPLTLTVWWAENGLWDFKPMPYHAVNILLHAFSAVLLFFLLRRLRVPGAWVAAALWALHPVNVESVAWVTEMKNTLSAVFFLVTLHCWLEFDEHHKNKWYGFALLSFAAALLSKPSTVPLPAVLLLLVWWQHGKVTWKDALRTAPFFAFAAGMSCLAIAEQQLCTVLEGSAEWQLTLASRIIVAGKALRFYAGTILWPLPLSFIYPRWNIHPGQLAQWDALLAALAVAIVLIAYRRRSWARACLFGLGYFILMLAPVSGLANIYFFRYSFVSDHFCYLASIGLIALVTAGVARAVSSRQARIILAATGIVAFGTLTWERTQVFRSDEILWTDTLCKNPNSSLAHNNYGNILRRAGHWRDAAAHYRAALRINRYYPEAHNNYGIALAQLNQLAEAQREFAIALTLRPSYRQAHENMATLLLKQNRNAEALQHLRIALELAEVQQNPFIIANIRRHIDLAQHPTAP